MRVHRTEKEEHTKGKMDNLPVLTKPPGVYGLPVPGSETPDSTPIYRHPDFVGGLQNDLPDKNIKTIWDLITTSCKKYSKANCQGTRPVGKDGKVGGFTWKSYGQVFERVTHFAAGLKPYMKKDVTGEMKLVGLMGINSPEWTCAEWATLGMGGTTVPIYTTTPKETLDYILNLNGCSVVVADIPCAGTLVKAKPTIPTFETLIVYGNGDMGEVKNQAEAAGLKFLTFADVEAAGKAAPAAFEPPSPTTIFSFIFTSGSTGMPKGALLTHQSQISVLSGSFYNVDRSGLRMRDNGREFHLSYLPSAHIMERAFQIYVVMFGGSIGYFQGKREALLDDLKTLRPTIFVSVPRLLNMIYDKIMNKVRATGGIKEKLFNKALNTKVANLKNNKLNHPLWDALVFKKLRKTLGLDRARSIITGSAPIAGPVLDFYRAVFGVVVVEGYGATETCASATLTHPLHFSSEHVGGPSPNVEIKLVSLPQMNYLVTDSEHLNGLKVKGRGEICVRGMCIMREYYRNPEATAKAVDKDGFYHTGDVGAILPNGCVKIFDRVGNVFKLSIGEYVAPEKVENMCTRSNFVASMFVHGDAFHPKLVAIVVPDPEVAAAWAKENGAPSDLKELCKNEAFKKAVLTDIDKVGKKNGLQSYEVPKDIYLEPEPFTVDTVLTATLKMQRKKAQEYYASQLKDLLGPAA